MRLDLLSICGADNRQPCNDIRHQPCRTAEVFRCSPSCMIASSTSMRKRSAVAVSVPSGVVVEQSEFGADLRSLGREPAMCTSQRDDRRISCLHRA